MLVELGNVFARVIHGSEDEIRWMHEYLSFPDKSARWRPGSDGRVRLFSVLNNTFPAGFMAMVQKAAAEDKLTVEVVDKRTPAFAVDPNADLGWLRWYQLEAVSRAVARERGIIWVPTGGGKTEIITGIVRSIPCKWLLLVHRTTLMDQAAERYELRAMQHNTGDDIAGRIGEGAWAVGSRFTCATFPTIYEALQRRDPRVLKLIEETDGLLVDEAHVLPAATFYGVGMAFRNARYRFGLSGTPLQRTDRRSLHAIAALGQVVYRVKTETLIEEGVLARPTIRFVRVSQEPCDKPTWQGVYGASIVRSATRNRLVVEAAKRAPKPALVFVKETTHGKLLKRDLERAGLRAEFVYGAHNTKSRKRDAKALVQGRLDVLIASVVFQEGVDLPELRSVIVASGGESIIAALQRIGRGMRTTKEKDTFDVYDFYDTDCGCRAAAKSLGTPGRGLHKSCKWLAKHSRGRMRSYVSEGHKTSIEDWVPGSGKVLTAPVEELDDTEDDAEENDTDPT